MILCELIVINSGINSGIKDGKEIDIMTQEDTALMEPMMPAAGTAAAMRLENLVAELIQKSALLSSSMNPIVAESIGELVRSMNCYYSNLIEGHDTHPIEIDKALAGDMSHDPEQRNLQLEAKAHIEVQRLIDEGHAPPISPAKDFVLWVHEQFCSRLPPQLLSVSNPDTHETMEVVPGQFRTTDVQVGRHIPPMAQNLERFMRRFEQAYDPERLSTVQQIIAVAASHHRFVWIHPFLDGNGRVVRLFSHACLRHLRVGSSLWSVSRGLARGVAKYKDQLMAADAPRRGDLDGRGTLSLAALESFCEFFLQEAVWQVEFMTSLIDSKEVLARIKIHTQEQIELKNLPKGAFELLREAWTHGAFDRGEAERLTGYKERAARGVLAALLDKGYLVSDTQRGSARLGFAHDARDRWLPGLYPHKT